MRGERKNKRKKEQEKQTNKQRKQEAHQQLKYVSTTIYYLSIMGAPFALHSLLLRLLIPCLFVTRYKTLVEGMKIHPF